MKSKNDGLKTASLPLHELFLAGDNNLKVKSRSWRYKEFSKIGRHESKCQINFIGGVLISVSLHHFKFQEQTTPKFQGFTKSLRWQQQVHHGSVLGARVKEWQASHPCCSMKRGEEPQQNQAMTVKAFPDQKNSQAKIDVNIVERYNPLPEVVRN